VAEWGLGLRSVDEDWLYPDPAMSTWETVRIGGRVGRLTIRSEIPPSRGSFCRVGQGLGRREGRASVWCRVSRDAARNAAPGQRDREGSR
jgi:hypothetical protein